MEKEKINVALKKLFESDQEDREETKYFDQEKMNEMSQQYLKIAEGYGVKINAIMFMKLTSLFDEIGIFMKVLNPIDEKIRLEINENVKGCTQKIEAIAHYKFTPTNNFTQLVIVYQNMYQLFFDMVNNIKWTRDYHGKPEIINQKKEENNKKRQFFFPQMYGLDLEMYVQAMIQKLLNNGDTRAEIEDREMLYTTYKYCKILEQGT